MKFTQISGLVANLMVSANTILQEDQLLQRNCMRVSWNLVNCYTTTKNHILKGLQSIHDLESQGHRKWRDSIRHMPFPIFRSNNIAILLLLFRDIITFLVHPTACDPKTLFTRYNRLSNRLNNRFDNRLNVCLTDAADSSTGCSTGLTTGCIV